MKKTVLGLAALTVLAFTACKKDEGNSSSQTNRILGKWKFLSTIDVVMDYKKQTTTSDTLLYTNSYKDFRKDGYVYSYEKTANEETYDTLPYKVSGTWVITSYPDGEKDSAGIGTLTDTTLSLHYTFANDDFFVENSEYYHR